MCVVFTRQKFSHVSSSELELWQGVFLENGEAQGKAICGSTQAVAH